MADQDVVTDLPSNDINNIATHATPATTTPRAAAALGGGTNNNTNNATNDDDDDNTLGGTGEEVQLLQEMISERDKKIKEIHAKLALCERQKKRVDQDLVDVKARAEQQRTDNQQVRQGYAERQEYAGYKLSQIEVNVKQQKGSLHTYADLLGKADTERVDSSYVVRMQSQLCKAMHSMGILEHQLNIVKECGSDVVKNLKDGISKLVEEKSQMELSLMNKLVAIDDEKRSMEDAYKDQVTKEQDEIAKSVRGNDDDKDEDEDNEEEEEEEEEESDDEDEIDEDLLKEILEERLEEIKEMEEANKKQAGRIAKMQRRLGPTN